MTNDHNPRTLRQLPPEMRIGARRRQSAHAFGLLWLAMLAMAGMLAAWIATYGLPLGS